MARCPSCDTVYGDELAACPSCGAAAEAEVIRECTRCGQEFSGGDACPACGLLFAEQRCVNHPDRAAAGRCVLCGRALCSSCAHDGRRVTLCAEHRDVPMIEGWAQVYSTTSALEAQLLRENLQAEGISAQVFSQKDMMLTVDVGELSIVRVLVPVWEYGQAKQVIRDHMDVQGEVAFACAACGEAFDAGARACAACGAALV